MIIYRQATANDLEQLSHIEKECFSVPWSKDMIQGELEVANKLYMVAELDGKVIGYGGAWIVLDEGQITNIAILPEYRRAGYGGFMTRKLLKELIHRGCKDIFLEVRVSNIGAQTMYRRLGFTVAGIRKKYYTDPVEDAFIMTLTI